MEPNYFHANHNLPFLLTNFGQLMCYMLNFRGVSFVGFTPLKIDVEPKMKVWKMSFLFKQVIFRFHDGSMLIFHQCRSDKNFTVVEGWFDLAT